MVRTCCEKGVHMKILRENGKRWWEGGTEEELRRTFVHTNMLNDAYEHALHIAVLLHKKLPHTNFLTQTRSNTHKHTHTETETFTHRPFCTQTF